MRACILSVSGPELSSAEASYLKELQPWALILMGRSCVSKAQVQKLVDDIWAALERPCLIFIDQEGGRVARLKAPEWPVFPPAANYGALFQASPDDALEACRIGHMLLGHELAELGIHADCSPVVDLPVSGAHDIIGDRAFARDVETIGLLTNAALQGLSDAGVAGVIKHIPGHGRARADSHEELPVVSDSANELDKDFRAFELINHAPMAMTAHILYPEIDPKEPATTSKSLISNIIRKRIGFDGLLMSDDLGMKALGGPLSERAERALSAGCDVVLHCAGFEKDRDAIFAEMREVGNASWELQGKPLERALQAEAASTRKILYNADELRVQFNELMRKGEVTV
tara:strand:- start:44761 stop:45795 length:1035 start_codon:yes stop_codon:yes gene_type:complete